MGKTRSAVNSPSASGTRKRLKLERSSKKPKRFNREFCNQSFTEHRSLLRHKRESGNHGPFSSRYTEKFSCLVCPKTFARIHDRERHCNEQHLDGKTVCTECGPRIRPISPHKNHQGKVCRRGLSHSLQESASSTTTTVTDLSRCRDSFDNISASFAVLENQLVGRSKTQRTMCLTKLRKNVRNATVSKPIPCGICGLEFQVGAP